MSTSTPSEPYSSPPPHGVELLTLDDVLLRLTPRVVVTPLLILANVVVLAAMLRGGAHWLMPDPRTLLDWGANHRPLVLTGDWWRLVSCLFVHVGVLHLAANMWGLYVLGPLVERFVGHVGMVLVYFVSGVAASLATLYWNPAIASAGASGAVFGVLGALMGFVVRQWGTLPGAVLRAFLTSGLIFIAVNVGIGLSLPFIDNAAHLGGLGAGLICGLLLSRPLTPEARRGRAWRNLILFVVAGLGLAGAAWGLSPTPQEALRAAAERFLIAERHFRAVEDQVGRAYADAQARHQAGELDGTALADLIDRDILPPWKEATRQLEAVPRLPPAAEDARQVLLRSLALRGQAWELEARGLREDDEDLLRQANIKRAQADALLRRLNRMVG